MGHRRAEQRHDPVAHDLVDRALVAVDGLHHPLEHRVQELGGLLGVPVGQQLHRPLEVGEEEGDLLALAFEGALGSEDLLGEMFRGVGVRRGEATSVLSGNRAPTGAAELLPRRDFGPTLGTGHRQASPTVFAELQPARFAAWHRGHCITEPPVRQD
jgi:hypothetical protein